MEDLNQKTYNAVLDEANDYFKAQGMSIIGEGYKEIATSPALLESYVEQLTEGASANDAANISQLMLNTNAGILKESSMTGIQPIASLSMPVIRKLWPKFALKDAIKTEVAKTPRFVVAYTKPYIYKGDGLTVGTDKFYLPRGLKDSDGYLTAAATKNYTVKHTVALTSGAAVVVDFRYVLGNATATQASPAIAAGTLDPAVTVETSSAAKLQPLDELVIESVIDGNGADYTAASGTFVAGTVYYSKDSKGKYSIVDTSAFVAGTTSVASYYTRTGAYQKLGKRLDVMGSGIYDIKNDKGEADGQLVVRFDGANFKATLAYVGGVASDAIDDTLTVVLKAGVSSEYNETSWSVGFDIARQDIDIPTGEHINASLPIEGLNDMMALYQIDGTKETVDLMTNIFAMKLDVEVLTFLKDSFVNQPGNEAFADYATADSFMVSFDCKPAAGFAGSPKAWREEAKPLIDHLAQKIKNATYLQAGIFTIICNPIDAQILSNVDWQFRGGQGSGVDGVDVDYSVGTYVGANAYKVIASTNVPTGAMYMLFTPSSETQMTYKYYPYTFSTEMGYIDPNRSRVPSIMMTKRQTFQEFMPAIGCIQILNNDGAWFNSSVAYQQVA
jgi:hypothetical protein